MNAWQSPLLNQIPWLTHATSTRDFGSLRYPNEGETEDPYVENRAAFAESLGTDAAHLFLAGNEHGNVVSFVDGAMSPGRVPYCDGLLTSEPTIALALKSADCLPIFFVDPTTRAVAISHAGWKGVTSGIAIETVRAFLGRGSRPQDLLVAIGPSIGPCHYSVHDERRDIMLPRTPFISEDDFAPLAESGVWSLDLRAVVVRQLVLSGVFAANIDASAPCTACQTEWYFSYRLTRDGANQLLSVVCMRPDT
ncbi:peptidoglycan editing factor PgeF [bacterium]|nr:peptidoglycan editing factor PgeF [bacterium]